MKLHGNRVGTVQEIKAHDYVAQVTLRLRKDTPIPQGTRAEVRTTAPMGEAYVELTPPDRHRPGQRCSTDGDRLPLSSTATAPDVSDLLVALSATVTGGPFADISTIIKQLNVALDGRTGDVHDLLARLDTLVTGLNAHTDDIDRVLDGMDRLGGALAADAPTLSRAIDDLTPAITTLRGQRADLMKMLGRLTRLSTVSQRVIGATKESLVRQVNEVGPVLSTLIANMDRMRPLMQGVLDFGDGARLRVARRLRPLRPHRAARTGRPLQPPGRPSVPTPGSPTPTPPTPSRPPGLPGSTGASRDDPLGLGGLLGGGG